MRLDDCEEEESEVTQSAWAGKRGGEEEKEEMRGQEADEEKMAKDMERGEKGRGCAPRVMRNGCRRSSFPRKMANIKKLFAREPIR